MTKLKKSKWVLAVSFLIFAILMGFWPYFDAYFPKLDSRQVIGFVVALIFGMFLYFDERLDSLHKSDVTHLKFGELSEVLLSSLKGRNQKIRTLDVFAFTTGVIQPIVSNYGLNVDNVRIIVMKPDKAGLLMAGFENEVMLKVKSWQSMSDKKMIVNLNIRYYDQMPSDYFLLIDNITVVAGLYSLDNKDRSTPVEIFSPFCIDQVDSVSENIVSTYRKRFEALWKYCK